MSGNNSTPDSKNESKVDEPWHHWPHEMPQTHEKRHCKEYEFLHNHDFRREMHQEIRVRAFKTIQAKLTEQKQVCVLLSGGTSREFEYYDTDTEKCEFRQESYFRYLFQINEPDCYGALNLATNETYLFVPPVSDDAQRWNGDRRPLTYYTERYGVTETFLTDNIADELAKKGIKTLYTLKGMNLDSGNETRTIPDFPRIKELFEVNDTFLHPILAELRVLKTPKEIELMRVGGLVSSQAHVYVMRHIRSGMTELQLEALFKSWVQYHGGCRHMAYTCICGSGANGSILHYGHAGRPNDRILRDGDSVVLDMGAEYHGYATDLTRSYAVNGKFSADQKIVHDAVYDAQQSVLKAMRPGVFWPEMHRLAEKVIIEHLIKAGVLGNGSVEDMVKANIGSIFMPHGLGHLLGLDTHDVGGYPLGESKSKELGLCWLRCGRKLEAGMVITVEPGLYFNDPWLDKALANPEQSKFINADVLKRFRGTGGCRLEDDVLVTENGVENFSIMPTSVQQIEAVLQGVRK